ncbi:MAG: hypothetical protein DCC73_12165 [Proteobacteria bacterium]|jgi:hypothetical protein|nr:MAG: hypothetical protein DCC73_12165 [Pseudomonadota bacterium]
MGQSFRCVPLDEALIDQVFPLLAVHEPWLTPESWRKEARRWLAASSAQGAFVALRDEFARGILLYDVMPEAVDGRRCPVLRITAVLVFDLLFANDIAGALVEAAERYACVMGYAGVAVSAFCPRDKPALRGLHVAGPVA